MVTFPYNNTDFAYTLNDVFIQFSSETEGVYFTLDIEIKYYDFYSDVEQTKTTSKKIPLFKYNAKLNVGRIVHRYMRSIQELVSIEPQYKPAKVTLIAKEILAEDLSVLNTDTLTDVKFIAGHLPTRVYNNVALLHRNINPCRITPNGFVLVSFLLPTGTHNIVVTKNEEEVDQEEITITEGNNIITKQYTAVDFNAKEGDLFKVKIQDTLVFYEFLIFPATQFSNMLVFLNEYKLKSSLELIGGYAVNTTYDQITETVFKDLKLVLNVIDTTKEEYLTANTGFVLKTDVITIDSLLFHKKAWLLVSDTQVLELVPIAKKLAGTNTDDELFTYTLELKINAPDNAQNYTF